MRRDADKRKMVLVAASMPPKGSLFRNRYRFYMVAIGERATLNKPQFSGIACNLANAKLGRGVGTNA